MGSSSQNVLAAFSGQEANSTFHFFTDSDDSNNDDNESQNTTKKSASQTSPSSPSRGVTSGTDMIQLT